MDWSARTEVLPIETLMKVMAKQVLENRDVSLSWASPGILGL